MLETYKALERIRKPLKISFTVYGNVSLCKLLTFCYEILTNDLYQGLKTVLTPLCKSGQGLKVTLKERSLGYWVTKIYKSLSFRIMKVRGQS